MLSKINLLYFICAQNLYNQHSILDSANKSDTIIPIKGT